MPSCSLLLSVWHVKCAKGSLPPPPLLPPPLLLPPPQATSALESKTPADSLISKNKPERFASFLNIPISQSFPRSEEHTSELQSRPHLVCRLLLEKKKKYT